VRPFLKHLIACVDNDSQRLDLGRLLVKHLKPLHSEVAREVIQCVQPMRLLYLQPSHNFHCRKVFLLGSLRLQLECLDKLDQMAVPSSADPVKEFNTWLIKTMISGARTPYNAVKVRKPGKVDAR